MKEKEFRRRGNKPGLLLFAAACLIISGCAGFGSISLNNAVMKYDDAVLKTEQQSLLLNIIRMHDDQPPHFTAASSISATFTLSSTGTLSPYSFTNNRVRNMADGTGQAFTSSLSIGGTFTESPMITIMPMQGKEFAERLLGPVDVKFVTTILFQRGGNMFDKIMRLTCADFYLIGPEKSAEVFNIIKNAEGIDNPKENKTEDKKIFQYSYDFKRIKKDDYKYPFDDLKNMKDNNGMPSNEAIGKLKDKGFSSEEAFCLLSDDCYMKNTPPTIISLDDKNNIKRESDTLQYELFRKIVLHIRAVQLCDGLYYTLLDIPVEEIKSTFKKEADFKEGTMDIVGLFERQYLWQKDSQPDNKEASKPEIKEVTNTESKEVSKSESKEVSKKENKEVTKTESKEVTTKSEKKEVAEPVKQKGGFILKKYYTVMTITDFDYTLMNDKDKQILVKKIQDNLAIDEERKFGESVILVLLRGGGDNDWPIYGYFTLRNFRQVMQSLADSLKDEPGYAVEYNVEPSKLTNSLIEQYNRKSDGGKLLLGCLDNPGKTLTIRNSTTNENTIIKDPLVEVDYKGKSFWISNRQKKPQPAKWSDPYPLRWDGQILSMLYEMFQFNRNTPAVSTPSVTISK